MNYSIKLGDNLPGSWSQQLLHIQKYIYHNFGKNSNDFKKLLLLMNIQELYPKVIYNNKWKGNSKTGTLNLRPESQFKLMVYFLCNKHLFTVRQILLLLPTRTKNNFKRFQNTWLNTFNHNHLFLSSYKVIKIWMLVLYKDPTSLKWVSIFLKRDTNHPPKTKLLELHLTHPSLALQLDFSRKQRETKSFYSQTRQLPTHAQPICSYFKHTS